MTPFIVTYMSSLTNYTFEQHTLERIAMERGVTNVESVEALTRKQKDLILADMLLVLFLSPTQTPSLSKKHGQFSMSIGSQIVSDKDDIYDMMIKLYTRWGDEEKLEDLEGMGHGLEWLD